MDRDDAWRTRYYKTNRFASVAPDFTNPAVVKWWKDKPLADYVKAGCFGWECPTSVKTSRWTRITTTDAPASRCTTSIRCYITKLLMRPSRRTRIVRPDQCALGNSGPAAIPHLLVRRSQCEFEEMASTLRAGFCIGLSGVPFWRTTCGILRNFRRTSNSRAVYPMDADVHVPIARALQRSPLRVPWT